MMRRPLPVSLHRQRGAALFVALILLLILTLIGVTAAQMQTVEERMTLNDQNHQLALQSGEAVLRDSEAQFLNGDYENTAAYPFDGTNGTATLSTEAGLGNSIADQRAQDLPASSVPYAGPALGAAHVGASYVLLENLPPVSVRGGAIPSNGYPVAMTTIRTTSLATGGDATANSVTQSITYRAPQNH